MVDSHETANRTERADQARPEPARGKLGVLIPGLGAVSTTLMAGVFAIRKGLAKPVGSLTQMATIRLGKRTENRSPMIKDFVPLAGLDDLVFAGWDIFEGDCYTSAVQAGVLDQNLLARVEEELRAVECMPAVFDPAFVRNLSGPCVKQGKSKRDLADQLAADIRSFKAGAGCSRLVMIWCASTETYCERRLVHESLEAFEAGLEKSDPAISPSMIYAYVAIREGIPFINGAPNLTENIPALLDLARETRTPVAGDDFKTGQTMMKTALAPALKARMLGLSGWFSTNILGNRDGLVLDDPDAFKTKEQSKLSALEHILQPHLYPDLYREAYHKVRINYYPPRGDEKEGWDNIDLFGWLGYPMQIKIDFLCRDSILAAPLALDLVLFMDLAARLELHGIQEWLSFYFKNPITPEGLYPEHDLFIQLTKLKNNLRYYMGEELITHLGVEYYLHND